jgi:hypothetical protein
MCRDVCSAFARNSQAATSGFVSVICVTASATLAEWSRCHQSDAGEPQSLASTRGHRAWGNRVRGKPEPSFQAGASLACSQCLHRLPIASSLRSARRRATFPGSRCRWLSGTCAPSRGHLTRGVRSGSTFPGSWLNRIAFARPDGSTEQENPMMDVRAHVGYRLEIRNGRYKREPLLLGWISQGNTMSTKSRRVGARIGCMNRETQDD